MAPRGLDTEMIANFHDVVERRLVDMSSRFEASLVDQAKEVSDWFEPSWNDQVKDKIRKAFHICVQIWSLLI